jgi:putative membrane protein
VVELVVLAVDRDDDIGRKAGIVTPVIGRERNLEAATKLALEDPEDSDVNTIFAAVKTYDRLKAEGRDVEIVTISGDERVGVVSDSKIAEQLDFIARKLRAKKAIVVTDGSEDEFILPLISSRFSVNGVSRVVVKQSKTIESTYFLIKRMMDDPKIARATLAPLGVFLLIYSIFTLAGYPGWGSGAIVLFVGIYLLLKAYGFERALEDYFDALRQSLYEGRVSFITYVISAILIIIGLIQGFNVLWKLYNSPVAPGLIPLVISFIYGSVWWMVAAALTSVAGKVIDHFVEGKPMGRYKTLPFLIISSGLVLWGGSIFILSGIDSNITPSEDAMFYFLSSLAGAVIIGLLSVLPKRIRV